MNNWWIVVIFLGVIITGLVIWAVLWSKKDYWSSGPLVLGVISAFMGVVFVVITALSIILPIYNEKQFNKYKQKYEYVMSVIDNMNDYQYANLGITQTILEYNEWLDNAKAAKETYGNWSYYKDIPLEELDYIGLKNKGE